MINLITKIIIKIKLYYLNIIKNNNLYFLKLIFQLILIPTNYKNKQILKYLSIIIIILLWLSIFLSIYKLINKLYYNNDNFQYNDIGMIIWMIYSSLSYSIITIQMLFNYNLFIFLEVISYNNHNHNHNHNHSDNHNNPKNRNNNNNNNIKSISKLNKDDFKGFKNENKRLLLLKNTHNTSSSSSLKTTMSPLSSPLPSSLALTTLKVTEHKLFTIETLNYMSTLWISLSAFFGIIATIATIIVFGERNLIRRVVPTFHNEADIIYLILLFISNVTCPIPMVIVRLGSYFTEHRILSMIYYLENEQEHLHNLSIVSLMKWYDDVYKINILLSEVTSPFVTSAILILLPQAIFLLQGSLLKELSFDETMCLFVWVIYAVFMLLVICCSVANLDALNRRFEIALGCIVSKNEFASSETVNAFDLALAKAKALPFGVTFYGTNALISYSSIYKVSTIIISIFLFFVGYS